MLEEFLAVHVEDAAVVLLAEVGLEHGGGVRTEGAVHEDFDVADAEHVVAEAAAQTEFVSLVEQFDGQVFEDAQFEPALRVEHLQCHEGVAAVEIVDAGQPHLPQDRLGFFHRIGDLRLGRVGDDMRRQRHGGFEQDAGRVAVHVALDLSVLGVGRLGGDVRQPHGGGVDPSGVQ